MPDSTVVSFLKDAFLKCLLKRNNDHPFQTLYFSESHIIFAYSGDLHCNSIPIQQSSCKHHIFWKDRQFFSYWELIFAGKTSSKALVYFPFGTAIFTIFYHSIIVIQVFLRDLLAFY